MFQGTLGDGGGLSKGNHICEKGISTNLCLLFMV